MDARPGGPTEPEQTDWECEPTDTSSRQSGLGRDITTFIEFRLEIFAHQIKKKKKKKRNHKDGAGQDTDECESLLLEVEAIYIFKHKGERLEPHIEESVNEGQVFNTVWPL